MKKYFLFLYQTFQDVKVSEDSPVSIWIGHITCCRSLLLKNSNHLLNIRRHWIISEQVSPQILDGNRQELKSKMNNTCKAHQLFVSWCRTITAGEKPNERSSSMYPSPYFGNSMFKVQRSKKIRRHHQHNCSQRAQTCDWSHAWMHLIYAIFRS